MLRTAGNQRNGNATYSSLFWNIWVCCGIRWSDQSSAGRKYAWLGRSFWPGSVAWLQMRTREKKAKNLNVLSSVSGIERSPPPSWHIHIVATSPRAPKKKKKTTETQVVCSEAESSEINSVAGKGAYFCRWVCFVSISPPSHSRVSWERNPGSDASSYNPSAHTYIYIHIHIFSEHIYNRRDKRVTLRWGQK